MKVIKSKRILAIMLTLLLLSIITIQPAYGVTTTPLIVIGLFFGLRYRFNGPGFPAIPLMTR